MTKTAMNDATTNGFLDLTKIWGNFRIPGLDVETIVAIQRKNLEAFTQANQLAAEGARVIAQRQAEIIQQAVEQASAMFRDLTQAGAPEERVVKNVEVAKQAFEQSMANARELTELATKTNTETFNLVSKRFTERLDEVRDYAKKQMANH
jgi:phasin family protein